jgi:hypothetical protein
MAKIHVLKLYVFSYSYGHEVVWGCYFNLETSKKPYVFYSSIVNFDYVLYIHIIVQQCYVVD